MNKITEELKDKVENSSITKVIQSEKLTVILTVKREGKSFDILFSVEPQNPRIYITSEKFTDLSPPHNFSLTLKKHILNGKILSLYIPPAERILKIDIKNRNEIGDIKGRSLIVEIMGRHSNIILIDGEDKKILGCIKHITSKVNRYREIIPNKIYIAPPYGEKKNPMNINEDNFLTLLMASRISNLEDILVKTFSGTGLIWAKEIIIRSGLKPEDKPELLTVRELKNLYRTWETSWKSAKASKGAILYKQSAEKLSCWKTPLVYPVELTLLKSLSFERITEINKALEWGYKIQKKEEILNIKKSNLLKDIKNYRKKLLQMKRNLEENLKNSEKAAEYKKKGKILLASMNVEIGEEKTLELVDIFTEEEKKVKIEINPSLSISENAQKYFKKYKKAMKIKESSLSQIEPLGKELEYLDNIILSLEICENASELEEIKEELIENQIIKKPSEKKKKKDFPSFITFTSPDGWEILVGKNNKQNDFLTTKIAKGNDIWLHAKGVPGSHVIIKNPENKEPGSIPYSTLLKASTLAARYSKGKNYSQIIVDYTQRKFVKKPKGAKPGMVIYHDEKSICLFLDEKGELRS